MRTKEGQGVACKRATMSDVIYKFAAPRSEPMDDGFASADPRDPSSLYWK